MFKGSIVAIITPFTENGLDEGTLRKLITLQIESGTNGIVPCGTTGESPTLSPAEHNRVIEVTVEAVNKRVPVIAGTGSNSTAEAVMLTKHAAHVGADAALVVTPYYNKPTQRGLYLHFKAVAESVDIPIILYNIAGRTARNIETETVAKLNADCPNIVGVKEASGSLEQVKAVRQACGPDFIILSGDDALTLPMMELGGTGVISVAANIVPEDIATLTRLYAEGKKDEAAALDSKLKPLINALFLETNPIPVKTAAELMGLAPGRLRLPLCEMEPTNLEKLKQALLEYGALTTV
ncbi:MAG: 4-hydroxy-tetrahydrodipicolinate synthase [Candidatus Omnitrophica bacterium]|nr:4-hydroxy-tetrahydrodipicolinate synthase [Candidatus Omnitrophota bacterium]